MSWNNRLGQVRCAVASDFLRIVNDSELKCKNNFISTGLLKLKSTSSFVSYPLILLT